MIGHDVVMAGSGQEALALMEKSRFDVVITDYVMPNMKGDELAATIKARDPKQPVIMITAFAEMLHGSTAALKNVDHLISKPFLLENLREALAKATGAPRHKS